jgi:hypothetical protein
LPMPWPSCCRTCTGNLPPKLRRARQRGSTAERNAGRNRAQIPAHSRT